MQTFKVTLSVHRDSLKASLLQCKVEVSGTAHILIAIQRIVAVSLIKRRGTFFIGRVDFAFICKEVTKPVVLTAVFIDSFLHAIRHGNLVIRLDDLFGTFDDPRQNATASVVVKVLAIILDVAAAGNLGVERDDDKSSPDVVIGCRWLV